MVAALADEGIDLLRSAANYESPAMSGSAVSAASTRPRGLFPGLRPDGAHTRRRGSLAVTGGFRSRHAMAEAVASGDCDVVGIARPAATNPDAMRTKPLDHRDLPPTRELAYSVPRLVRKFVDVKAIEGMLNLSWNTDQIHRLRAAGPMSTRAGWPPQWPCCAATAGCRCSQTGASVDPRKL